MKQLYTALIINGISYECLGDEELGLKDGDMVVVKCEHYSDCATITGKVGEPIVDVAEFERQRSLNSKGRHVEGSLTPLIIRKVTPEDLAKAEANKQRAETSHRQTRERIQAHGLEMKLIHTHISLDNKLILFQFSADGRIDFRELLRDLTTLFRMRVELRQIGVRDEAAVLGGIGICGRPFCCSRFLHTFNSINVKMAKQQGISLNPQNISGCCGRLKCCLYYEADAYKDVPITAKDKHLKVDDEMDEKELEKMDERESADSASNEERQRPRRDNRDGRNNRDGGKADRPRREIPQRDVQPRDNKPRDVQPRENRSRDGMPRNPQQGLRPPHSNDSNLPLGEEEQRRRQNWQQRNAQGHGDNQQRRSNKGNPNSQAPKPPRIIKQPPQPGNDK
ncbi:MAG: hypothetical protein IKP00_12700 [Victivallales bacterium]|nr:hypothetical protein [Victivallales bacterium]